MQQQLSYQHALQLLKEKIQIKEKMFSILGPSGTDCFTLLAFEMGRAIIKLRRETHWEAEVLKQLEIDLGKALPGMISLPKLYQLSNFYLGIERMARCINWGNKAEKASAKETRSEGGESC